MAVTADKIVVEIEAKLDRYVADIRTAQRSVEASMDRQAAAASRAEKQIKASAEGIRSALAGAASGIAAGVSVGAIQRLADSYTQFTNQLKTAGLEGAALVAIQDRLFQTAQKNGVELEALGTLYGRMSSAAKELKLNQQQQLAVTDAVAAALKIQGGSTEQASGALLQLSQALGGSKIQAEEYNSLIDGLRPLLQGVADASTKYGGSVAKLTAAVKDGKVTSAEFVQLIIKASDALENKAAKSTSTMSAGLTTLNNAFSKYIGETDKSLGLTERFGQAIKLVSDNLETIIPGLVTIIGIIGVRYAAAGAQFVATEVARTVAMTRSALAAEAAAAANLQLAASGLRASVSAAQMTASISGQAVAMGVAGRAAAGLGSSLLAAFGGPVGVAILAVAAAIAAVVAAEQKAAQATAEYKGLSEQTQKALASYADAALAAATASGSQAKGAREAAAAAKVEAEQVRDAAKAKLESAKASLALLAAEAARIKNTVDDSYMGEGSAPASAGQLRINALQAKQAQANYDLAKKAFDEAVKSIKSSDAILTAKPTPTVSEGEGKDKRSAKEKAEDAARAEGRYAAEGSFGPDGKLRTNKPIVVQAESIDVKTIDDVSDLFTPDGGLEQRERDGGGNFKTADERTRELRAWNERYQDDLYDSTYESIRGGLEAGFRNGLPGLLQYLGDELTRTLVTRLATALTEGVLKRGGGGGDLFAIAGSLFGRANGGNMVGGVPYKINEGRPEVFVPPSSGKMVPVSRLVSRSSATISPVLRMSIDLSGANGDVTIARIARQAAAQAGQAAYAQAMRDAPAAVAKHQGNKG